MFYFFPQTNRTFSWQLATATRAMWWKRAVRCWSSAKCPPTRLSLICKFCTTQSQSTGWSTWVSGQWQKIQMNAKSSEVVYTVSSAVSSIVCRLKAFFICIFKVRSQVSLSTVTDCSLSLSTCKSPASFTQCRLLSVDRWVASVSQTAKDRQTEKDSSRWQLIKIAKLCMKVPLY